MTQPTLANVSPAKQLSPAAEHSLAETRPPTSGDERFFLGIAGGSTALALGVLLASVEAVKIDAAGVSFSLSLGTLAAFAAGAFFGFLPWELSAAIRSGSGRGLWLLRASMIPIVLSGVGAFLYPLRFVSAEKLPEVLKGLATAACALSIIAFMLWQIHGFLERDTEQTRLGTK